MFQQILLTGQSPYESSIGTATFFPPHRHSDIEISYCQRGSYEIIIDHQKYTLNKGDFALILPMETHEYFDAETDDSLRLTIILGPNFLEEHYKTLIHSSFKSVYSIKNDVADPQVAHQLSQMFEETIALHQNPTEFSRLRIHGNLYQICALILEHLPIQQSKKAHTKNLQDLSKIEKALEIIRHAYAEPISIDTVSRICGYSKSNFCTIFKNITGATFHSILNQHRIEVACQHLQSSDLTIEEVSEKVGFTDTKSFCRVFKKLIGTTAGEYRKKHRAT